VDSTLTQRIDFALFTAPFGVVDIHRVGISPFDKTDTGLWPSDHAGLVATFVLPAPHVRVPEEQILNPGKRTKRLYFGDPLSDRESPADGPQRASEFHLRTRVPTVVGRFFNAFGPNETNPHLFPEVQRQVLAGARTLKLGNLDYGEPIPERSTFPRFYYPEPCSSSTIAAAGIFAHAALVFATQPQLKADAEDLSARAQRAFI
jgi:hypothetical protein